jgi:hypothetical protein
VELIVDKIERFTLMRVESTVFYNVKKDELCVERKSKVQNAGREPNV